MKALKLTWLKAYTNRLRVYTSKIQELKDTKQPQNFNTIDRVLMLRMYGYSMTKQLLQINNSYR